MEMSPEIKDLAAALAKAQAVMEGAQKDGQNPHFRSTYPTLASVWDACRTPLASNGLSVVQGAAANGCDVQISTLLLHISGQWIKETLTMVGKDHNPQSVGSVISYGRRYQLAAMVGIAPVDDDAEAGEGRHAGYVVSAPTQAVANRHGLATPSFEQPPSPGRVAPSVEETSGQLTIVSVRVNPTKNANVKKAVIVLSDGRQVQTIKDKLIALCEQLQQEVAAVDVQTKTSDKWGEELTGVTRALPVIQINGDLAPERSQTPTLASTPFNPYTNVAYEPPPLTDKDISF